MNQDRTAPSNIGGPIKPFRLIAASSIGTLFEWYDLIIFGSLAPVLAKHFFSPLNPSVGIVFALLLFGIAYLARPIGAAFFGHIGDTKGRKIAFVLTVAIMGVATTFIGFMPTYATIGIAAPLVITILRFLQGFALGGEYGGAVTYLSEHSPAGKRGLFTSWLQTTGPGGVLLGFLVILVIRLSMTPENFSAWGWRIPFLLSFVLLLISVWLRLHLSESPVFAQLKKTDSVSHRPLIEIFTSWSKIRMLLLTVFGFTAGLGVIWYTTLLYTYLFLIQSVNVPPVRATILLSIAVVLGLPFFVIFGALSDKIGRTKLVYAGLTLSVILLMPVFHGLTHFGNSKLSEALTNVPVSTEANPTSCSFQLDITKTRKFTSACDVTRSAITKLGINNKLIENVNLADNEIIVHIGNRSLRLAAATTDIEGAYTDRSEFLTAIRDVAHESGYPTKAEHITTNDFMIVILIWALIVLLSMSYGPTAAMISEMFNARTRYSEMSLGYHIGTGWFGGFVPSVAFAISVATGNIYAGLWFPIIVAVVTIVLGSVWMKESSKRSIDN